MTFNDWWENVGQRIQQSQYSSREEFIKCIARMAWEDAMESSLEEMISFEALNYNKEKEHG